MHADAWMGNPVISEIHVFLAPQRSENPKKTRNSENSELLRIYCQAPQLSMYKLNRPAPALLESLECEQQTPGRPDDC
jgi:hypothetical protein